MLGTIFENRRTGEMNNDLKKKKKLSAQYLFNADVAVFVFHQCQSNHGTVFQASVITPGRKKKRAKEQWNEGGKI